MEIVSAVHQGQQYQIMERRNEAFSHIYKQKTKESTGVKAKITLTAELLSWFNSQVGSCFRNHSRNSILLILSSSFFCSIFCHSVQDRLRWMTSTTLPLSTSTAATSPSPADQPRLLHEQSRVTPTSTTFCFGSWSLKFPSPCCFRSLCVTFASHAEVWSSSSNNIFAAASIMFVWTLSVQFEPCKFPPSQYVSPCESCPLHLKTDGQKEWSKKLFTLENTNKEESCLAAVQ